MCGLLERKNPWRGIFSFYFLISTWSIVPVGTKNLKWFHQSIFKHGIWFVLIPLVVRSKFSLLHNSLKFTFATQLLQVLYFYSACLLHSLRLWIVVSSVSSKHRQLGFCCVLSTLTLTLLVYMALCRAAIIRASFSFLRLHCLELLLYKLTSSYHKIFIHLFFLSISASKFSVSFYLYLYYHCCNFLLKLVCFYFSL